MLFGVEGGSICFIKIIQDAGEGLSVSGRSQAAGVEVSVSPPDPVCVGEHVWHSLAYPRLG